MMKNVAAIHRPVSSSDQRSSTQSLECNISFSQRREEAGISQRQLVKKTGWSQARIRRFEKQFWEKTIIDQMDLYLRAIGSNIYDLFFDLLKHRKEKILRSDLSEPFGPFSLPDGVRLKSFTTLNSDVYIGALSFEPQKTLSYDQTPKSKFLFFQVLKGRLLLSMNGESITLKAGNNLILRDRVFYELYSSEPREKTQVLVVSRPSFL